MLLRDPLVHFLAIGALLFAVFAWRGDGESAQRVRIAASQVEQISRNAALLEGRPPTPNEIDQLLEPVIRDEVYYREALALGLDVGDDEVRDRLIDKMRYLTENLADPEPASLDELQAFFASERERFTIPELATFDQVFFSPSQRGNALEADVSASLTALVSGAEPAELGDRTPLESRLQDATRERVRVLFGDSLTLAVFSDPENVWQGPFTSDFGLHLIRVIERQPARLPEFSEIEEQVRAIYGDDRRREANEAAYQAMRSRYEIVIDWPAESIKGSDE
jgi:peptidyl-prolyl cis-trans isomerase C